MTVNTGGAGYQAPLERREPTTFPREQMAYAQIFYEVLDELGRAHAKFPNQHLPWGGGPNRMILGLGGPLAVMRDNVRAMVDASLRNGNATWLGVVAEEFLEAGAEDYLPSARAELIQMVAMGCRAILDIDRELKDRENAHVHYEVAGPPPIWAGEGTTD